MHDVIVSILNECIENDRLSTTFSFKNKDDAKDFEKIDAYNALEWLNENGYNDKADIILDKKVFHAILVDMCNFIYESLNTIEKGKITVSLALLRKPFRDNLLYLEWLLAEPKEFIDMVYNQEIDKYAIENVKWNKKKDIINKAISKIDNQEFFSKIDANVYYDLRYNYAAGNSLQLVWNNANHLVTTGRNIRSDEFNFIFLNKERHLEYIKYYYNQVPHLLFYTYNIIIKLYDKYIRPISDIENVYNNSLIVFKFCDRTYDVNPKEYFNEDTKVLLSFPCGNCKKNYFYRCK